MENKIKRSDFFLAVLLLGVLILTNDNTHDWYGIYFVIYYFLFAIFNAIAEFKQK